MEPSSSGNPAPEQPAPEPTTGWQPPADPWWRTAVLYEVYVRSFADSDGDGIGDLGGVRSRLGYLRDLGVDGIWLTPFYRSPMADHGYDVADHRDVDPLFGDLDAFDDLLRDAHALGLKILVDLVPNHSSDAHPAFQAALASPPGSEQRRLYLFRDGTGPAGSLPPNNWVSLFGGPAWAPVPPVPATAAASDPPPPDPRSTSLQPPGRAVDLGQKQQWYLHLFAAEQPDWNWSHPQVHADHERTLRFWFDRGVDGFRIDVSHGLVKDAELRDNPDGPPVPPHTAFRELLEPRVWDQDGVHDIYRSWRRLVDDYNDNDGRHRVLVGETWVADPGRLARYVRPDELHLTFAFALLAAPWSASAWRAAISGALEATAGFGSPATWVLANHDVPRPVTRYGGGETGLRRARAALLTLLALPGTVFLYQGDELGLPQVDVPPEQRHDPVWRRSGGSSPGRDGSRIPMPWSGEQPPFGFTAPGVRPWLPQPADWAAYTAQAQAADAMSTLVLVRGALALRHALPALAGSAAGSLRWRDDAPAGCLAFDRLPLPGTDPGPGERPDGVARDGKALTCVMSTAGAEVSLTLPGRLVLASSPVGYDGETLALPPGTAAWVAAPASPWVELDADAAG